jgi:hypothetical protein
VSATTTDFVLSEADRVNFEVSGYLVLPGLLPEKLVARLKPETDRWVDEGFRARSIASCVDPEANGLPPLMELEMPAHGELLAYPPLMSLLTDLIGTSFVYHHMHSDRQEPGRPGKAWHHDYEQSPQGPREFAMVHTLHYLDGLDEDTASLVVLPGSHREVAEKTARAHLGEAELPGEVVFEHLPKGSTVILHSALFHARRARPGSSRNRYFLDVSYCQTGTLWPPVKPFWRHMLKRGRELHLAGERLPELFAERHFTEYSKLG